MNHARKAPSRQLPIKILEALIATLLSPAMKVRLARHRAAQSPTDRVLLGIREIERLEAARPPSIRNPGRRAMSARLEGRIVHYGVGRAKRGEYGTPREVRAHERGMTRSGYQTIAERGPLPVEISEMCPPTERNDR